MELSPNRTHFAHECNLTSTVFQFKNLEILDGISINLARSTHVRMQEYSKVLADLTHPLTAPLTMPRLGFLARMNCTAHCSTMPLLDCEAEEPREVAENQAHHFFFTCGAEG